MIKDYSEEEFEEKIVLTEAEVAPILDLLLTHPKLFIEFPSLEFSFNASTVMKMIKMASLSPEESIRFTLRQKMPSRRNDRRPSIKEIRNAKRKLQIGTEDEDLVISPLIIPTIDNNNNQIEDSNNNNKSSKEKHSLFTSGTPQEYTSNQEPFKIDQTELKESVMDINSNMKYNGVIGANISLFFVFWIVLYIILLVLSVFFGRHAANFYAFLQMGLTAPVICEVIVCILSFVCGTTGIIILIMLYLNKENLSQYSSTKRLNPLLITDIVVSFTLFIYLNYLIRDVAVKNYIINESSFSWIVIALIINQTACLLFNLKMDHFVQEYQLMNGLAVPLLK